MSTLAFRCVWSIWTTNHKLTLLLCPWNKGRGPFVVNEIHCWHRKSIRGRHDGGSVYIRASGWSTHTLAAFRLFVWQTKPIARRLSGEIASLYKRHPAIIDTAFVSVCEWQRGKRIRGGVMECLLSVCHVPLFLCTNKCKKKTRSPSSAFQSKSSYENLKKTKKNCFSIKDTIKV